MRCFSTLFRAGRAIPSAFLLVLISFAASAQDLSREQQIGEEMAQRDPRATIWLEAGGQKFAGKMVASVAKTTRGGIVLLHGPDSPPDSHILLAPLIQALRQRGWNTLSITTALPEQGASTDQYMALMPAAIPRIEAAIKYLNERNSTSIVLLGYSTGALAALRFAAEKADTKLAAITLIDPPSEPSVESALLADLEKIKAPLMDLVTNRTKVLVQDAMLNRKRSQRENPGYRQSVMIDASTGYGEMEEMLANRIHGWLVKTITEQETPSSAKAPPVPGQNY